ncbi:endo-1,4-beta-xylanase [Spinactinospora alkalitolerans]|uniref:Beta-xylanase n=1 Tax=Spinactinospora alkalitolerans TaxID=687207 RepID=A0A852TXG4_9ACTN|nr:endo-1,4-beta-xylanase [Spinactinospora alkalitolerans]NYE48441.1 endo-1,4-beta-xylanase [Spinactinospora alkalitolerans]
MREERRRGRSTGRRPDGRPARFRWWIGAALTAVCTAAGIAIPSPAQADGELRDLADARGFEIGAALGVDHLANDSRFADLAAAEFNAATAENSMKWDAVQPSRGQFDWSGADDFMAFARANDQAVRGHTLVWHSQLPSWVSNGGFGAGELRGVMEDHIDAVAGRYAGQVAYWDVVNEMFNEDGSWRQSVFYDTLGESYVADALRMAAEADPNAELYLNDYNIDGINAKSDAYYDLARSLLNQGVPLDGIGMQAHLINGQIPSDMQRNIQRFADLGLDVAITELDIRIQMPASQSELEQQAQGYRTVMDACMAVDRCIGVTVWGIVDQYSWVPDVFDGYGAPLLFNDSYQPKPAYYAVQEALGGDGDDGGGGDDGDDGPGGPCEVDYSVQNEWNSGFTGQVSFTHNGSSALDGWELQWTFPSGQQVTSGWSGEWSQSGSTVTVSNASWNAAVQSGGSVSVGFNASHNGGNTAPTAFTLNGQSCAVS